MRTMYDLEQSVRDDVRNEGFDLVEDRYYQDKLHEIADNNVPVYYHDLAMLLAENTDLAYVDDKGLIEGVNDVFKIIQTSIYEKLMQVAYESYEEFKEEYEEKQEFFNDSRDEFIDSITDCETMEEVNTILESAKALFAEEFPENTDRLEEVTEAANDHIEEITEELEAVNND